MEQSGSVPLLFFVMSFFHIRNYCHNNGKRFAVMLGTFFLFAVYSSFSFPAFITEDTGTDYELKNTDTQNISLAEEKEPDMQVWNFWRMRMCWNSRITTALPMGMHWWIV